MQSKLYKQLEKNFPFISVLLYGINQDEFVGLIQNQDNIITGFYDFGALKNDEDRKLFLTLADQWFFESNRQLPINIYLKEEWAPFRAILKIFITKEIKIVHGPTTSLSSLNSKKKRRSITMMKRL